MSKSELKAHEDKAEVPGKLRLSEQSSHAVHQITAIDHLFTKGTQDPSRCDREQNQLLVVLQIAQLGEVSNLVEDLHQHRLGDKELQQFHADAAQNSDGDGSRPICRTRQPNIAPPEFTPAKRDPHK